MKLTSIRTKFYNLVQEEVRIRVAAQSKFENCHKVLNNISRQTQDLIYDEVFEKLWLQIWNELYETKIGQV